MKIWSIGQIFRGRDKNFLVVYNSNTFLKYDFKNVIDEEKQVDVLYLGLIGIIIGIYLPVYL